MPGPLYYVGLAMCLLVVIGNVSAAIHYQKVQFLDFVLYGAFLIGLVGTWRLIIVDVHEVRVWGLGIRRRFPLLDLWGIRTREGYKSALTPGNVASAGDAVSHTFRKANGKRAFRVSVWINRRQECVRLILKRIRRARESTFE